MDIPDLVKQELGDEEIQAGVTLGDEDAVCFTSTRTLVYRGEGLLSDEKVAAYPFDFERLTISEGRRKTKFTLVYTDGKRDFGVPGSRADAVLERLIEGTLRASNAIDAEEQVTGVFRFSELTLVITEGRLLKHIGSVTWDNDFESYPFDAVTGLDFEKGSVATAIVLVVDDRPERIKAPSDQAAAVRKTLQEALFAFHEVASLSDLNAKVATDAEDEPDDSSGLGLESGIDPLVSDDDDEGDGDETAAPTQTTAPSEPSTQTVAPATDSADDGGDIAALEQQVADLTTAIERQNERIEAQEETIQTLIEELRQGR
ncbi:DUF7115 domain-containing protein [Haloarcula salinisoli]|uniref:DUF7115 domain-containing protein n=1 Tax=Haloarcula salinisoli TaxID=2487746 RepID=A0A8J8C957_9EURY|nr:hypothetical protein [Halomicroarcula salinisoli]MBX0287435.1 hypothetical protein [Halomicroarcula salinisoli]MBX0304992.1 hypothetical protein [Halomicroarcula salinisoli]